jgi:hypothetical protein
LFCSKVKESIIIEIDRQLEVGVLLGALGLNGIQRMQEGEIAFNG